MTRMMQSMRRLLECFKFNALLVLLTLILHDRFSMVFGITVNPLDSFISDDFTDTEDGSSEFTSDAYDLNNLNHQFGNGYNKYVVGSQEVAGDAGTHVYGSSIGGSKQLIIVKQPSISENQSDGFNEYLKMFSIPMHHSVHEVPNFFNNRILIKSRYVTKPYAQLPFIVRPRIVRPVPSPQSPIAAITDGIKDGLKAIYPGTLWCGDGNHAKNHNEVGLFRNTDICCKQHDECPAFIKSGSEFKGLRNTGFFTRSHCDCDMKFYNCLKRTDSLISNKIGYTYFNILRPQCFRKEYPIMGCRKWINKRCIMYIVDDQRTPAWQWFENKFF